MAAPRIHPLAEASLRVRIGAITGVHVVDFTTLPVPDGFDVVVRVGGRSPSLNAAVSRWQENIRCGDDHEGQAKALLEAFAERIAIQEERARDCMDLGSACAFGVAGQDDPSTGTHVGHVMVDRGLARLLQDIESGLVEEVRDSVWLMHQEDVNEDDGTTIEYEGETSDDDGAETGEQTLSGRTLWRDVPLPGDMTFDGRDLKAKAPLPETVLAAVGGRRLGEIVEVPAAIADHVIESARSTDEGVSIRVESSLATLDELAREWLADKVKGRKGR